MTTRSLATVILAIAVVSCAAAGQSIADLFQKGIYTQETVGDLDGAIRIYRQVISAGTEAHGYTAQALYRLGLCLHAKGDSAGAIQAFEKLVKDYPDEKELAAKVQQYLPRLKLLPVPWPEREYAEYRFLVNNQEQAPTVFAVEPSPHNPQNVVITLHNYEEDAWARAEADRETMRPVLVQTGDFGGTIHEYQDGRVRWTSKGKTRNIPVNAGIFDFEEDIYLMRRLPVASGYQTTVPLLSPAGLPFGAEYKVTAVEDVETPAGKFRCFKVEGIGTTKWYSMDAERTLVKLSEGAIDFELSKLSPGGPPVTYRHESGVGFQIPPGWFPSPTYTGPAGWGKRNVLTDPEHPFAEIVIWSGADKTERSQLDAHLAGVTAWKEKSRNGGRREELQSAAGERPQVAGRRTSGTNRPGRLHRRR